MLSNIPNSTRISRFHTAINCTADRRQVSWIRLLGAHLVEYIAVINMVRTEFLYKLFISRYVLKPLGKVS